MGCFLSCQDSEDVTSSEFRKSSRRGCTDWYCTIIFFAFFIGTFGVFYLAFQYGDPRRILRPMDTFGNMCGTDGNKPVANISNQLTGLDLATTPHLIFYGLLDPLENYQVCVKECPYWETDEYSMSPVAYFDKSKVNTCLYGYAANTANWLAGYCPKLVYKSKSQFNRCIPTANATQIINSIGFQMGTVASALNDLPLAWPEMLVLAIASVVIALIMVAVLKFLANILVYVVVIAAIVGIILANIGLWYTYVTKKIAFDKIDPQFRMDSEENEVWYFLAFAIFVSVISAVILVILIAMWSRLKIVIDLFYEAAEVIGSIPFILLTPFVCFIFLTAFVSYCMVLAAFLLTTKDIRVVQSTDLPFKFVDWTNQEWAKYAWFYVFVAFIWGIEFIFAASEFVIAFAASKVYFDKDSSCPIGKAVYVFLRYHFGTIALGSFIITMVKIPRMILMYIEKKLKGSETDIAKFILKCMTCCLWCLEKILKFINRNTYIITAINGADFCSGAQRAVEILVTNAMRVAALNSVGDFILFLAKLSVSGIVVTIGVFWMKNTKDLDFYFLPLLLVGIFAYFIADCFFDVYEMILDTLLMCFCEDTHRNKDDVDGDIIPTENENLKASATLKRAISHGHDQMNTIRPKKYTPSSKGEKS